MVIIFDSSTLILLAKIDILRDVTKEFKVIIPNKVKDECTKKDLFDAKIILSLLKEGLIEAKKVGATGTINKLCKDFSLHLGEAEALYLAMDEKCLLAVDDGPTMKACRVLNVRFLTAIHFLIKLVKIGKMDKQMAMAKLEKLSFYGRYNRRIVEDALNRLEGGI